MDELIWLAISEVQEALTTVANVNGSPQDKDKTAPDGHSLPAAAVKLVLAVKNVTNDAGAGARGVQLAQLDAAEVVNCLALSICIRGFSFMACLSSIAWGNPFCRIKLPGQRDSFRKKYLR